MPSLKKSLRALPLVLVGLLVPALTQGYTLSPFHWDISAVPIYFRFDPGIYNGAFFKAMNKWNAVNKRVQLLIGSPGGVGTDCSSESNAATFRYSVCGAKWGEDVLAITLSEYSGNGTATHGAVIFNSNIKFDLYDGPVRPESVDMNRVALHELGHFLGLNHEMAKSAIMQPRISGLEILTIDDIKGIQARYP
jgi:hypothetical protein